MGDRASASKIGLWSIGLTVLLAGGAALGVVWASPAAPEALRPATEVTSSPVGTAKFDDTRTVRLDAVWGGDITLAASGAGLVTRSSCQPGVAITSGSAPLAIDDAPVLALATTIPLWRDLDDGMKGNDVRALQDELARLGYPVAPTGTMGEPTRTALRALLKSVGGTLGAGAVLRSQFLWIPGPSVVPATCTVGAGGPVEAGAGIATIPGALAGVSFLDGVPGDLVPGPRVLHVDGVDVPVVPGGPITEPAALAALGAAPSIKASAKGEDPPTAQLRLAAPIDVSIVPPSGVVTAAAGETCVVADGAVAPVRVVGSELGETFVVFDGDVPRTVETHPARGTTCS